MGSCTPPPAPIPNLSDEGIIDRPTATRGSSFVCASAGAASPTHTSTARHKKRGAIVRERINESSQRILAGSTSRYDDRIAVVGDTLLARHAGRTLAITAVSSSTDVTATKVTGSAGLT